MSHKLKILLLEDVDTDTLIIKQHLNRSFASLELKRVSSKTSFEKAIKEFIPDLILSDYIVPGYSGMEALSLSVKTSPDTPFIFVTGALEEKIAVDFVEQGAWDYVLKDNLLRLIPAVKNALKLRKEKSDIKKVQEILSISEAKYKDLYENAPDMYLTIDMDTAQIVECNYTLSELTGYSKNEIVNHSVYDFYPDKDIHSLKKSIVEPILKQKAIKDVDIQLIKKDGSLMFGKMNAKAILDETGYIIYLRAVIRDITEKIQMKAEKEAVQKQYQILFESSSDAVYIHPFVKNGYGNFIDVNILACKSLGYTKEELLQMNVKDIIGDKSKYRIKNINREDFEITKEQIFESVHKRKDGTNFPVEINSKIVEMNGRKIIISNVRDITERKRAEQSLKESEERFALAIKAAEEGVWDWETNSDFVNYSDQWKAQLGYEPHELENSFSTLENLLHPEDHDRMIKEVQNYLENPVGFFIAEFRLLHKVGSYVWIRNKATCVKNKNGKVKRLVGAHTDITETKLWENALIESEEKYRLLANNIPDYIYLINKDLKVQSSNIPAQELFKSQFKTIDGKHLSELFPEKMYHQYKKNIEIVFKDKKTFSGESELIVNGSKLYIYDTLNPVFDKYGDVKSVIGVSRDITERKLAEEALLESEERFRSIFNTSDDPILILSLQSGSIPIIKDMNEVVCRKYKFNRKDLIGKKISDLFPHIPLSDFEEHVQRLQKGEIIREEITLPVNSNQVFVFEAIESVVKIKNEDHILITGRDITQRKFALNALAESEERFRTTFNQSADAVIIYELKNNRPFIFDLNIAAEETYGYKREELTGQHPEIINHKRGKENIHKRVKHILKNQKLFIEAEHVTKNGTVFPVEIKSNLIQIHDKKFIYSIYRNLTERVKKEQTIKKLSKAINQSPVSVVITNAQGNIEFVNPAVTQSTGYSEIELIGQNPRVLKSGLQNDQFYKDFWKCISSAEVWTGEFHNKKKNGELFWEKAIVSPLKNDSGEITHYIAIKEDVTEQKRIEQKLIESEQHFRKMFEQSLIGMYVTSDDGQVLQANRAFYEMLGFDSLEEMQTVNLNDCYNYLFDREKFKQRIEEIGHYSGYESVWKKNNGELIFLRESSRRYTDEKGRVLYEGTVENITDWKKAQIELKEIHEFNNKIIKVARLGYACFNKTGDCIDANDTYADIVGATKDQILSQNYNHIENWKNAGIIQNAERCLKEGIQIKRIIDGESTFKKQIWIEINLNRIGSKGNYELLVILKDITAFIRAKRKQLQAKAEYHSLIENMNIPVFGINRKLSIKEWNDAVAVLSGFSKDEISNKPFDSLIHFNDGYNVNEFVAKSFDGESLTNIQLNLKTKSNGSRKLLMSTALRKNEFNEVEEIICAGQDITEMELYKTSLEEKVKERTNELIEALQKEKELGDMKSQFVSMASHEFRTPLAAISFSAGFIKKYWDRMDDEKRFQKLDKIDKQVKHMTNLLDDVLIYGKAESGKINVDLKYYDLAEFLNETVSEIRSITNSKHQIKLDVQSTRNMIRADEKLLRNIFVNLMTNAVKFSPKADVVDIRTENSGDTIITSITDYGIGIDPKDIKHIFTPFLRGRNVETIQGTGLGLAIMKQSVELMNGTIAVESKLGEGSTFTVKFPICKNVT